MAQLSVTMPDELAEMVDEKVKNSPYFETRSEAIRYALRKQYDLD